MGYLNAEDIEYLAIGAAVLGTGGGGDPYLGKLMAKQAIKEKGPVRLISVDDLADDDWVIPTAMMGAPAVLLEKLPNGGEPESCFKTIQGFLEKPAVATMSLEAGGINSCIPVYTAARLQIPLVDADGMGRAFPEIPMVSFSLDGVPASPMVCVDEKGNQVLLHTIDNAWVETLSRAVTVAMGLSSMIGLYVMSGETLKKSAIRGTISLCMDIGKAIVDATSRNISAVESILKITKGYAIFEGKLIDVQRELSTGFVRGRASFEGIGPNKGQTFDMDFQNENLIGYIDGEPKAMVPDLITVLDLENGTPITTETLRYGQRVVIIGMPCAPIWRTEKGLKQVGPRYFKYDLDYVPIEELVGDAEGKENRS
ncbi:MAG: DUF917 domain-containing protein [Deltaproteobacteria bacterium]|nr:DUF917 domain-containing protein [Deltaproteobacteria bacterium]